MELPRLRTRADFNLLFVVLLVVAAGNTALQSVLPAIGRELAIPDILIALIFSFSAILWTLAAPFWAEQSDRRGRKRLIEIGLAGYAVSTLLGAVVILSGLKQLIGPILVFGLFAVTRSLFGLFGSASNPAAQAYIAARTSTAERTAALAMLASAFGLGTILGPALAPFFVLPFVSLAGPLFVFALIACATLIYVRIHLPADAPEAASDVAGRHGAPAAIPSIGGAPTGASAVAAARGRRKHLSLRDPRIAPFVLYGLVIGHVQAATGQTLGFYIIDRLNMGPADAQTFVGVALMAGAGATLLAQWGLIPLLRMGPRALLRWGCALAFAGTLATAFAEDFHAIVVAFALTSLGYGFARPGFTAGASLAVGSADQGAVAGAITSVNGASFILAPAIGISLYQLDRPLPFLVGAGVLVGMFIYTLRNPLLSADWEHRPVPPADMD